MTEQEKIQTSEINTRAMNLQMITVSILFLMGLWGCLAIYNATVFSDAPFLYAGRQLLWLFIGLAVMWLTSQVPFSFYDKFKWYLVGITYSLLILVLILGIRVNGMRGWFDLGFGYFQPSEFSKPFFIISLCAVAKISKSHLKLFINLAGLTVLWSIPLILQPDFGTLLIYLAGFITVYLIAGGKVLYLLPAFLSAIPAAIVVYHQKQYVAARVAGYLDPEKHASGAGWHILQFQYTMARGGFSGQSWGKSLWANAYLPLSYSDSSFASLVEAIGFAGTLPVIIGFCALSYAGYRLALNTKGDMKKLFICAMPMMISIQALVHMSVNVTMLPATGITLPIFSYGGSSLMSIMLSFGIILSAARKPESEPGKINTD